MDSSIVVAAQLLFLLWGPFAKWLAKIAIGILAADHEANLARWVGRNGGVGVFDIGEYLLAVLLKLGDQWEMEPLVLGYGSIMLAFQDLRRGEMWDYDI